MKFKKSTLIPAALLIYLAFMAYQGLPQLQAGRYLQYFGTLVVTIIIIAVLHFTLKYHERRKAEQAENDLYTTYDEEEKAKSKNDD